MFGWRYIKNYNSRLPSIALARVTLSAYSKSAPTGSPKAILEILIPKGLTSFVKDRDLKRDYYLRDLANGMYGFYRQTNADGKVEWTTKSWD